MALVAEALECPNCGASISIKDRVCEYCRNPIIVRRIQETEGKSPQELSKYVLLYKNFLKASQGDSVETRMALGICLLRQGTFAEAAQHLEQAIKLVPEDGESFYYLALALMAKKRPYLHTLPQIKRIVQYLETALSYGTNGKYYYLLHLIQKDFYEKKHLRNGKDSEVLLAEAMLNEVDDQDMRECGEYCGVKF